MTFVPFDILTAAELNNMNDNIVALADGSGLDNDAVTPDKRSGGYKVGYFNAPAATGNHSVTGIGFKPRLVEFTISYNALDNDRLLMSNGWMDEFGNQGYSAIYWTSALTRTRSSNGSAFVGYYSPGGTFAQELVGQYVSMDSDGFTVGITSTNTRYHIQWAVKA